MEEQDKTIRTETDYLVHSSSACCIRTDRSDKCLAALTPYSFWLALIAAALLLLATTVVKHTRATSLVRRCRLANASIMDRVSLRENPLSMKHPR